MLSVTALHLHGTRQNEKRQQTLNNSDIYLQKEIQRRDLNSTTLYNIRVYRKKKEYEKCKVMTLYYIGFNEALRF